MVDWDTDQATKATYTVILTFYPVTADFRSYLLLTTNKGEPAFSTFINWSEPGNEEAEGCIAQPKRLHIRDEVPRDGT